MCHVASYHVMYILGTRDIYTPAALRLGHIRQILLAQCYNLTTRIDVCTNQLKVNQNYLPSYATACCLATLLAYHIHASYVAIKEVAN